MSTATTLSRLPLAPSAAPSIPTEERGVVRGASWDFYDRLTDAIGDRSSVRIAFDGKDVELMVIGPVHEGRGNLLQVPEVWRFGDEVMSIEQLDGSGNYVAIDASRFLFVRPEEIIRWLREAKSMARPAWKRAVREWARAVLRTRAGL